MTWTAPEIARNEAPYVADERATLEAFLDYHRETLQLKCSGLTAEQLCERPVEPSSLSLLGLVRHMAEVERWWFRRNFAGEQIGDLFCSDESPDGDFDELDPSAAPVDFATYASEIELARKAVAGRALDESFIHPRRQKEIGLRWVYVHMIEEYARHNGHADLIRERIDGATGE